MFTITRRHMLRSLGSAALFHAVSMSRANADDRTSGVSSQLPPGVRDARALITEEISRGAATGVAVAVVHRGQIIWEEGFGWANHDTGLRATAFTPFTLASITKPFTATTLLTLVAEGSLSLDAPANRYLAKSKIVDDNGNQEGATVRFLGAHVSGLPTMYESYDLDEMSSQPNSEALLSNFGRLAYPPRACYEYSNIGFSALATIASNITGTDFASLLDRRVLQPLGLRNSFFGVRAAPLAAAARYGPSGESLPFYITSTPASGELYASAHDLALFAMFNMNNRLRDQNHGLSSPMVAELHKPVFVGPTGVATTFGWFRAHLKSGTTVISKIGGQPGVATALYMVPSEDLACLVLTNRSDGRDLCNRVSNCILSSYLREWQLPEETCSPLPAPFVPTSRFQGSWRGVLKNGDENIQLRLNIGASGSSEIAFADRPAVVIGNLQAEGRSLTGVITGRTGSANLGRMSGMTLQIKLLPYEERLSGRILATEGDPNVENVMLPYVVNLRHE